MYAFVPNKSFDSLLEFSPSIFIPIKTFNLEFQTIEVWFADQNGHPLEIEDKLSLTLVTR